MTDEYTVTDHERNGYNVPAVTVTRRYSDGETSTWEWGKLYSVDDVERLADDTGNHFFDPETLRFFNSRIGHKLYGGRYFTTSEKGPDGVRAYTVRRVTDNALIETVGEFQAYPSAAAAHSAAKRYGKAGEHTHQSHADPAQDTDPATCVLCGIPVPRRAEQ